MARPLRRRSRDLAIAIAAATAIAMLVGAGCRAAEGLPYECECEYLTDFDDASKQSVRVCAANDQEALGTARGCAQLSAPAPVQSCTCGRGAAEAKPCREGCRD